MDLDTIPEDSVYAGRTPAGHHAWRGVSETSADGKVTKFVLYSGREVRFNPAWSSGGDIIETKEFRLANWRKDPVVLADHNPEHVIGRGTAQVVEQAEGPAQLHGSSEWDLHESNPLAVLIAGQHARGMRSAVSIGFMPGKGSGPRTKLAADHPAYMDPEKTPDWRAGWFHRYPELYEFSSVAIPRDPSALQLQSWAAEAVTLEQRIERVVRELVTREQAAWVLHAVRNDAAVKAAVAGVALAHLPNPSAGKPAPTDYWESWK